MRRIFAGLTAALALAVVVQVFLAGNAVYIGSFHRHSIFGYVTVILAVAVGAVGLLARTPRRTLGTVGVALALILLQPVLAGLSTQLGSTTVGGLVLGLHAANALVIGALLGTVLRQTRRAATDRPAPAATGPTTTTHLRRTR